jgi:hypothetical protein
MPQHRQIRFLVIDEPATIAAKLMTLNPAKLRKIVAILVRRSELLDELKRKRPQPQPQPEA